MAGQRDRRVTVHLPESAGVHTIFEFTSAHRHLFGKLAIAAVTSPSTSTA